jgi:hypothetical protein
MDVPPAEHHGCSSGGTSLSEGVQGFFFSEHKNTKHTFPAPKKLKNTQPQQEAQK